MGYSISLARSVNRLTNDSSHIVREIIFCGEFVSGCTSLHFSECSNLLLHCRDKKLISNYLGSKQVIKTGYRANGLQ